MKVKILPQYSNIYPNDSTDESQYWESNISITSVTITVFLCEIAVRTYHTHLLQMCGEFLTDND